MTQKQLRLATLAAALFALGGCHRQRLLSWAELKDWQRSHPVPNEGVDPGLHFSCATGETSSAYRGPNPLPLTPGQQFLFPPDCRVEPVGEDAWPTCGTVDQVLPVRFGWWHDAESMLRELREPSLSGNMPRGVRRVVRFTKASFQWNVALTVRYVELEGKGIIIAKRAMGLMTGGGYGDYYREYPRRVVGPEIGACLSQMIDEVGFAVESPYEGFTPEVAEIGKSPVPILDCERPICLKSDWIIEQRHGAQHDVILQRRVDTREGLGIIFAYLLNLSGVDED